MIQVGLLDYIYCIIYHLITGIVAICTENISIQDMALKRMKMSLVTATPLKTNIPSKEIITLDFWLSHALFYVGKHLS